MTSLPTVAIVGATGNLGYHIVQAFLSSTFRRSFQEIIVLVRSESKQSSDYASAGAKVRKYSEEDLVSALEGVEILINAWVGWIGCFARSEGQTDPSLELDQVATTLKTCSSKVSQRHLLHSTSLLSSALTIMSIPSHTQSGTRRRGISS